MWAQSPELIAHLNKLKAEQEQAEYNRMITNVDRKWNQSDGMHLGQEIRSGRKQLASIVNFLLSVVATFAFGYRVLIGLSMAFAVAIAELYFMARVEI
ncbi:Transmembrane protein 199 [Acropora cervicornis]|uniref:Transmembrane protein 199 n=1 Tax=Acropora cervicornis TaxID=6130 RepID=A0AAD9QW65_ACRCE|nr:Transmembrane protein 199 [Acropora cervicornis]